MDKFTCRNIGDGLVEVTTINGYAFVLHGWHNLETISYVEIVPEYNLDEILRNIKKI